MFKVIFPCSDFTETLPYQQIRNLQDEFPLEYELAILAEIQLLYKLNV